MKMGWSDCFPSLVRVVLPQLREWPTVQYSVFNTRFGLTVVTPTFHSKGFTYFVWNLLSIKRYLLCSLSLKNGTPQSRDFLEYLYGWLESVISGEVNNRQWVVLYLLNIKLVHLQSSVQEDRTPTEIVKTSGHKLWETSSRGTHSFPRVRTE